MGTLVISLLRGCPAVIDVAGCYKWLDFTIHDFTVLHHMGNAFSFIFHLTYEDKMDGFWMGRLIDAAYLMCIEMEEEPTGATSRTPLKGHPDYKCPP